MKNERRHKLAQNSLARFIEKTINSAKEQSATIMLFVMVLLLAVGLFLAWQFFASKNKQGFYNDMKQLAAFNMAELDKKQIDDHIKSYITKYPSGVNNATVSLLIGDVYFTRASATLAEGKREKAIDHFETALGYYTTADMFPFKQQDSAERAVWGLAQSNAALAVLKEGDYMNAAKVSYERLCKTWPDGVRYELATERLNWLTRPIMVDFPAKYRQSDPVLFAPDLKIPEMTEPSDNIDTTIIPGDFQPPLDGMSTEGEMQEFDPALELPETPQDSKEPQNPEPVTALEPDVAP